MIGSLVRWIGRGTAKKRSRRGAGSARRLTPRLEALEGRALPGAAAAAKAGHGAKRHDLTDAAAKAGLGAKRHDFTAAAQCDVAGTDAEVAAGHGHVVATTDDSADHYSAGYPCYMGGAGI